LHYKLSSHASDVLKERNIELTWIEHVLNNPERCESDPDDSSLEHRLGRIEEYEDRVLRVIIRITVNPVLVITAFFDRRMRFKL